MVRSSVRWRTVKHASQLGTEDCRALKLTFGKVFHDFNTANIHLVRVIRSIS